MSKSFVIRFVTIAYMTFLILLNFGLVCIWNWLTCKFTLFFLCLAFSFRVEAIHPCCFLIVLFQFSKCINRIWRGMKCIESWLLRVSSIKMMNSRTYVVSFTRIGLKRISFENYLTSTVKASHALSFWSLFLATSYRVPSIGSLLHVFCISRRKRNLSKQSWIVSVL